MIEQPLRVHSAMIHDIIVLIARAAQRERALVDHLEKGIWMLTHSRSWSDVHDWNVQARALIEASRLAHRAEPQKAAQDAPEAANAPAPSWDTPLTQREDYAPAATPA